MRLDKFIASQLTALSRSDVKSCIKKGRVCINGTVAKSSDQKIDPNVDEISVDSEVIKYRKHIYLMLNKPQGVVCSTRDGLSPTVISLVPKEYRREGLFPAGRLDKDTEGFVLITDDGELAHRILSPKSHVPKVYYVELRDEISDKAFYEKQFKNGILLDTGEKCLPAEISFINTKNNACYVTLHEGMFHQVKKMFQSLNNKVVYLRRNKIGGLELKENLPLGGCIEIMHKDVIKLTASIVGLDI